MARITLQFDPFERKFKTSIEVPDEEYAAVFDAARRRFGGFLAELLQTLPFDVRLVPNEPTADDNPPHEEP